MKDGSQYGEASFILQHFAGRTGRFLDVGAFDGKTFSNTWSLAELGWEGVCIEPNPPAFCHLMQAYRDNPRVKLINAALVPGLPLLEGKCVQPFWANTIDAHSADMMSTLDPKHRDKWKGHPFREILCPALTWWSIFGLPLPDTERFDFINIDVEGLNHEVLNAMPYALLPEMVCVELDPPDAVKAGVLVHFPHHKIIGGNLLAWRNREL